VTTKSTSLVANTDQHPGAGGKGGPTRTYAIDRDAAIHFITASIAITTITKFLLVSYNSCRRKRAPWWNEEEWASAEETNKGALKHYYAAKIEADECLTALAKQRGQDFQAIDLRPGYLTDEKPTGKVSLGKMGAKGSVTRGDVADVAVRLLEKEGARGWIDLLGGEVDVAEAVERMLREGVDCVEGEDVEEMVKRYPLK
jgi:nucleoside-diphosphate-sugar epimerase